MTNVGRPPLALGVWPDMIVSAGGVAQLARALAVSPRGLRWVFTGQRSLRGARAQLARAFAAREGVNLRIYSHPSSRGFFLVSSATGWFMVPRQPGGWALRVPFHRLPGEDWTLLPLLEVDFPSTWATIAPASDLGQSIPKGPDAR